MLVILGILAIHFVADFVFQSSQMATNKSKSIKWLSIHVGVYGLVSVLSAILIANKLGSLRFGALWLGANIILHFMVDFFTSKATSQLWEKKKMRLFFTMIGFDQLLHNFCLLGTYHYFNNLP